MCNCRSEIEAKLLDRVKEQAPEASRAHKAELQGFVFGLTDKGITMRNGLTAAAEWEQRNKAGDFKLKKVKQSVRGTYCMFCGEKYDD